MSVHLLYWKMKFSCLLVFWYLQTLTAAWNKDNHIFKPDFKFGVSTSAYQVEGAWDKDGKGESIWDRFAHSNPGAILDGTTGDDAADSYHHLQRDVEMLRELGVDYYRFSISWSRVLPTGFPHQPNEKGLEYYDHLLEELAKYNIDAMVTMYHNDLPQPLQDLGGWANAEIVQWFEDYARVLFERYSLKIKYWITINEPSLCFQSYGGTLMAPGLDLKGTGDYMCVKNMLMAHAKTYRLFEKEYKKKLGFDAQMGISILMNWVDPDLYDNQNTENQLAAKLLRQFTYGLYLNPIFSPEGDFPKAVKELVATNSKAEGYPRSRLPKLSADEIKMLKDSADFIGVNHFTSFFVKSTKEILSYVGVPRDVNVEISQHAQWAPSKSPWLKAAPYGLYKSCFHLYKTYNNPKIFITAYGWSTDVGIKDYDRVKVMKEYLKAFALATEDYRILGFTYYSLMDAFEWNAGFSERFGLYEVDFNSQNKTRTARVSALFYKDLIKSRSLDLDWQPKGLNIEIAPRRLATKQKRNKKKVETDEL